MGFNSAFKGLKFSAHFPETLFVKVKVKQSHYKPGQALRVPRG